MELWTRVRPAFAVLTVEVGGEIDLDSGPCLRDHLHAAMRAHGCRLALDLTGVTFIDCAGVSALLATRRIAVAEGGWLRLVAVSGCVRRVIGITGLQNVLVMSPAGVMAGLPGRESGRYQLARNDRAGT